MGNSDDQNKISQLQYNMLLQCSAKRDLTEWNEWRKSNPEEIIWLMGANFKDAYLVEANLEKAQLHNAYFDNAIMMRANFKGALFVYSHLEDAVLWNADLAGSELFSSYLQGTKIKLAFLDDKTIISDCFVDKQTDFRGVGLGNIRIDPSTRNLLEYNIRRLNWTDWYKNHKLLQFPVRFFWFASDYGRSTSRILFVFFGSALLFAVCYYLYPDMIHNLTEVDDTVTVPSGLPFLRSLYFSIVTMTTLGFGDMYAEPGKVCGYLFLIAQVLLGYVILGALITRLNILFTAGGPSGKFADEKCMWDRVKQCADFIVRHFRK
jgi:hypothetical protein